MRGANDATPPAGRVQALVARSCDACARPRAPKRGDLFAISLREFTGISDPYDVPESPELRLETENVEVDNCAHQVILKLESMGLIAAN